NYYLSLIYFTILYYDYLVTLSAEVEYFWLQPRRLNWPSALFFANRYGAILGHIPFVIEVFLFPVNQSWVIFSGMHKEPLVLLGHGAAGCNPLHSQSQYLTEDFIGLAIAWSGLLVFDCSVFIFTVAKAFQIGRQYPGSLIRVLLRDGCLLFLANLSNILMYLVRVPLLKDTNTVLTNVLSTTAISRLMLNLRAAHEKAKQTWTNESGISRLLELSGPLEV
ncbi:hypothetical protein DENSPDRAFT_780287, partial [Dentipellis sp. KUC8613]